MKSTTKLHIFATLLFVAALMPSRASADVLEIDYTDIRNPGAFPTIVVEGSGTRYNRVTTRELVYDIPLRVREPDKMIHMKHGFVWMEGRDPAAFFMTARGKPAFSRYGWHLRRLTFPVHDLRAWSDPNLRLTPVRLCNDEIERRQGNDRKRFFRTGRKMFRHSAYQIHATAVWRMKGRWGKRYDRTWQSKPVTVGVNIHCRPLSRNRSRVS